MWKGLILLAKRKKENVWKVLKYLWTVVGSLTFLFSFWLRSYFPAGVVVILRGYLLFPLQLLFDNPELSGKGAVKNPWPHFIVKLLTMMALSSSYKEPTMSMYLKLSGSLYWSYLLWSTWTPLGHRKNHHIGTLTGKKLSYQNQVYGWWNCCFTINVYFQPYFKPVGA